MRYRKLAALLLWAVVATLIWSCSQSPSRPDAASAASAASPAPDPTGTPTGWASAAAQRLHGLEPCTWPNLEEQLLCGKLEVPEDRASAQSRTVALNIVVVPAQSETPPSDAIFVFEGGPGGAVTARAVGSAFSGPVRKRDIVLVDQRGTGGSGRLTCDLSAEATEQRGTLREMFPVAAVSNCAQDLSVDVDLRRYGSIEHADDIEAVRRHLGYSSINLRGGSYGTRAMMVYAQRYPDRVRTLFGIGVDSPLRSNLAERGQSAEHALNGLGNLCTESQACRALVPDLARSLQRLMDRLDSGPIEVAIDTQPAGQSLDGSDQPRGTDETLVHISRGWLAEQLRLILYFDFTTNPLPWAVNRAEHHHDWKPLARLAIAIEDMFRSSLATGVLLTVQCGENLQFDHATALAVERSTLFGGYRLEQQIQACGVWPHQQQPPLGVQSPRVLDAPAFFLSGAFDPVTPPRYGEDAQQLFPNSRHLVLPEAQHGPFTLENSWQCVHQMWADLLDTASPNAIDTECAEAIRRGPFITSAEEFDQHFSEVLAPQS